MSDRLLKIAEEIKKELSEIINFKLKDPRLPLMISIVAVKVAGDLKHAKVFVSVMGNEEEKKNAIIGLKSSAGFIRREIGQRIKIRAIPELHFELDNSIEHGAYITQLIRKTMNDQENPLREEKD